MVSPILSTEVGWGPYPTPSHSITHTIPSMGVFCYFKNGSPKSNRYNNIYIYIHIDIDIDIDIDIAYIYINNI